MQLRKRARRLAPTYDKINFPSGTRRQDSDFNQERNTHPTNNGGLQPARKFMTPRESMALNSARDSMRDKDMRPFGPMRLRGLMPTIRQYNANVGFARKLDRPNIGTNW